VTYLRTRSTDYAAFDEVVVQRITAGQRPGGPIAAPEAAEATRRLAAWGYSDGQIALRLGFTRRAVVRIRAKHAIAAALPARGANQHYRHHDAPNRPRLAG
jgi:hypothetical protein